MPLLKNGKDMSNAFIGDQELSKIMLGDKVVWENNKVIELGSGTSWNIKNLFPTLYDKLTIDNFYFKTVGSASAQDSVRMRASDTQREWGGFDAGLSRSYDKSTGILTAYSWINGARGSANMVMVLKPAKLIYLGQATGFTLKTYADWNKFTNNNFYIGNAHQAQTGNYFYPAGYDYSYSGTGTVSFNKSYDRSSGYLTATIFLNSVGDSVYYTKQDTRGLGIYLNPKVGA